MRGIFKKVRVYSEEEIIDIAAANNLVTVDCLKDDKQITVEQEGVETLYEFSLVGEDKFVLTWPELNK